MLISRRSTLTYGSVATALASTSLPSIALAAPAACAASRDTQLVQHLVIHPDEADGTPYCAPIALSASDAAWTTTRLMTEREYRAALASYRSRGYGLRRVNAFQTRRGVRYAAIWQLGHGAPAQVGHDMTADDFEAAAARFARQGYALAHVDASATNNGTRFAAFWDKSGQSQHVFTGLTAAAYTETAARMAQQGYGPQAVAGYGVDGKAQFAAVFARNLSPQREAHLDIPGWAFHARARAMTTQGYALRDASGYVAMGLPFYAAVWDKA
jgi:hypothetical protein